MSFKTLTDSIVSICQDVFGESISYTPNGSSPVTINGIFNNAWVEIEGVASLKPIVRIQLSDIPSPPTKGDQTTINSVVYRVMESQPDGYGGSTLILQKV